MARGEQARSSLAHRTTPRLGTDGSADVYPLSKGDNASAPMIGLDSGTTPARSPFTAGAIAVALVACWRRSWERRGSLVLLCVSTAVAERWIVPLSRQPSCRSYLLPTSLQPLFGPTARRDCCRRFDARRLRSLLNAMRSRGDHCLTLASLRCISFVIGATAGLVAPAHRRDHRWRRRNR